MTLLTSLGLILYLLLVPALCQLLKPLGWRGGYHGEASL